MLSKKTPEHHRSRIGVQAPLALGSQGSAQSCHPPKKVLTAAELERMERNRLDGVPVAKRQAMQLHGLLPSSSQIVSCKAREPLTA